MRIICYTKTESKKLNTNFCMHTVRHFITNITLSLKLSTPEADVLFDLRREFGHSGIVSQKLAKLTTQICSTQQQYEGNVTTFNRRNFSVCSKATVMNSCTHCSHMPQPIVAAGRLFLLCLYQTKMEDRFISANNTTNNKY